jgi:hypothetical protein
MTRLCHASPNRVPMAGQQQIDSAEYALLLEADALRESIAKYEKEDGILESLPKSNIPDYLEPSWLVRISSSESSERQKQITKLSRLKQDMNLMSLNISDLNSNIEVMKEKLSCLEKRDKGGSCSWNERFDKVKKAFDFRQQIYHMTEEAGVFYDDAVNLLVSLILRSIIFPLGLLYMVIRMCRRALRVEI